MGCTVQTMEVPIGASFKEPGMRHDEHDAVAANFWIHYEVFPDAGHHRSHSEPRDSDRHGVDAHAFAFLAAVSFKGGAAQHANNHDGALNESLPHLLFLMMLR